MPATVHLNMIEEKHKTMINGFTFNSWPLISNVLLVLTGNYISISVSLPLSVQFSSVAQSCPTLCDLMNRSTPGLPVYHQLPEFTQTHVHRVCDACSHLILCCPLLLLPPNPPSFRVFSNESTLRMRWPKYWSFSFSILTKSHTKMWNQIYALVWEKKCNTWL